MRAIVTALSADLLARPEPRSLREPRPRRSGPAPQPAPEARRRVRLAWRPAAARG